MTTMERRTATPPLPTMNAAAFVRSLSDTALSGILADLTRWKPAWWPEREWRDARIKAVNAEIRTREKEDERAHD